MIRALRTGLLCGLFLAAGSAAHAQDPTLDRVQNLAATGRFTDARTTLEQWERSFADPRSKATPSDRARALYLKGVLSTDAAAGEEAFLAVVLNYPSSSSAPGALLRLGQGLLTAGEPRRAVAYLERLRADYPGSPHRETGWLWLARAQLAAGSATAACSTAREGLTQVSTANLVTLLELERDNACVAQRDVVFPSTQVAADPPPPGHVEPAAPADPAPAEAASAPVAAAPAPDPVATPRSPAAASANPQFAVQVAAFRERVSAETIVREMRDKGFEARIVRVEGSPLHRVRFGTFTTREQAMSAARRVVNAGFEAIIVTDVRIEQ